MLECVISLEKFPFVERHYAELANVPSLALFLVNCANTALPSRILPLATFTLHTLPEDVFPHITQKSPRGGPREASVVSELMVKVVVSELMVKVALSLCLCLCGLDLICIQGFCHLHQKFFVFQI
jgi:hypothetical protein